ncbi:hypothetical protein ACTNED_09890, partial [Absicoccus porci]|uniref:hypothetical protein n=1 Tax=Absicoccus porci TaxID=2486576 RepID=UPI003F88D384
IPNTEVKHSRGEDSWACPCEHSTLPGPFFLLFFFFNENVPIVKKRLTSYFNERTMQIVRKNKGALTRDEASRFTS